MLAKNRAKICFVTISHHGGRWWVALNVEAADLHAAYQHPKRPDNDQDGWVGVDRGLSAFVVTAAADGTELARIADAPKALAAGMNSNSGWRSRCYARRKDHTTARMPPPVWDGITSTSLMCAGISYTKCPTRWSRPTPDSSSRT